MWYLGLIALVMHLGREIALGFASCYFTPFLDALLVLLIPNTTPNHPITYTYTVCTGKYHESVAVLSRVPQARVTIRLQTSDVSLYTLYNTFIMFPDPVAIGTRRYRGLGNGRGLATVAPRNQRTIQFYERTNGTASFSGRVGLTVQPEMAVHDLDAVGEAGLLSFFDTRARLGPATSKLAAAPY